ncbi:SatD family protein [Protaetiibacter mangrovi]|uniref:SatD family protein n=1 Tax=Protaetiibacter mangrovi TaxID=2970926 RepID=A0ABT1ZF62_9MICO|nr:SatD family protein [Protaetiibacter mangrovi]MCS0499359.1 SatD family protein [Protaetiibacter mangrovi]TPX02832.1 DNA-binding protein [Schumannella luteola]
MFALTADQIDSRHSPDRADDGLALLTRLGGDRLALPADRTAGDEIQALTTDPQTAVALVLGLARAGGWSIGLGLGEVRTPLPTATRATTGEALVAAREAVDAAKRRPWRVAVAGGGIRPDATTLQTVFELLLQLRERRSTEGWELYDLVESGLTQADAAERLGITPQAASKRAIAAGVRLDAAARASLVQLLGLAEGAAPSATEEVS